MLISLRHKFTFLSMPKCASTSVEHALKDECQIIFQGPPPSIKHINAKTYHNKVKNIHKSLSHPDHEIVCLIREPISWLHSWYKYRMRDELASPSHPWHINYTGGMGFDEFVEKYIEQKESQYKNMARQSKFIEKKPGLIGVDKIFKFEEIENFSAYMEEKIGKSIEIKRSNISPYKEMELSGSLCKKLKSFFEKDYEYYNKALPC